MGAWDKGNFENDSALDWVYDLIESDSLDLVVSLFKYAVNSNYIDEPTGSETLAAAEVVAAINGYPCSDIPDDLSGWLDKQQKTQVDDLTELAKGAIQVVKLNSELKELWEESSEYPEWLKVVEGLENRLNRT